MWKKCKHALLHQWNDAAVGMPVLAEWHIFKLLEVGGPQSKKSMLNYVIFSLFSFFPFLFIHTFTSFLSVTRTLYGIFLKNAT